MRNCALGMTRSGRYIMIRCGLLVEPAHCQSLTVSRVLHCHPIYLPDQARRAYKPPNANRILLLCNEYDLCDEKVSFSNPKLRSNRVEHNPGEAHHELMLWTHDSQREKQPPFLAIRGRKHASLHRICNQTLSSRPLAQRTKSLCEFRRSREEET